MAFIKKFYFIITCIFLLASCGLFGGDDKVDVTENSVLSGPPLSIPPEFDIDSQNTNQQQSTPTYDIETLDQGSNIGNFENEPVYESTQNENLFTDEIPYMTNIENTGEIQSFENFNPNIVRSNRQTNIITRSKIQRTYRQTVPSDGYSFDRILPKNQKTYAQKKKDNFIGFGTKNFEQIGTGDIGGLSKEEEFLLEDILNSSNTK